MTTNQFELSEPGGFLMFIIVLAVAALLSLFINHVRFSKGHDVPIVYEKDEKKTSKQTASSQRSAVVDGGPSASNVTEELGDDTAAGVHSHSLLENLALAEIAEEAFGLDDGGDGDGNGDRGDGDDGGE